jgi:HK97 family phage major capsid protein
MITYLQRLTAERDSLTQAATELTDRAAREERDVTETERASLAGWSQRCGEIDAQLTEYNAQAESQRAYARLRAELEHDDDAPPAGPPARRTSARLETRAWGDVFIASPAFQTYPGAGTSARVEVPFDLEQRAAIETGDLGTAVPPFTYMRAPAATSTPLLDVVGKVTTSSGAVQWVNWAPQPQTGPAATAEGEAKPEAVMTPTVESDALLTYAHWKGITRQALEDIPQIRSLVEGRLRQGLLVALEGAVVAALNAATIPPVTGSAAGGDTLLGTIRVGAATVEAAGYRPNAVLLNPADFAALDIAVMGGTLGGPVAQTGYWGLRPIGVPGVPAGTAYVGDFQTAVQLFTRAAAEVFLSDSHADYFIRNILLLLAEIRALATVPDPSAAAKCTVGVVAAGAASSGR